VFVLEFIRGIRPEICPKISLGAKNMKKFHGLPKFASCPPLGGASLFTTCHVGLHVDFSSMNFSWGL
jgi:hypothetical protein